MEGLFTQLSQAVEGSWWIALSAAFAWGILSILLSPCHLASIPLIVGFIGQQGPVAARRAFSVSLLFAVGILSTIAAIGAATALLGRMMGDVGPYGNYFVALIFFAVGLHLLDVLPLPFGGPARVGWKRRGFLAAFFLGLVFGIALGPCTFAYMAPILGVTFRLGTTNPLYGSALLLAYGLGHCSLIVLAGTFTSTVQRYLSWNERSRGAVYLRRACGVLVLFGGLYLLYTAPPAASQPAVPAETQGETSRPTERPGPNAREPQRVIAYYFHRTARCPSCLAIEDFSWRAIEAGCLDALGEGRLEWRPTNVDEPENRHFQEDFRLVTQSLVLARVKGEAVIEWKNLTRVWELLDNPGAFEEYVQREVAAYLR